MMTTLEIDACPSANRFGSDFFRATLAALWLTTCLTPIAKAQNLPQNGTVAAGTVSIDVTSPNQMDLNQTTAGAVVNWESFSIGQGATVNITQPGRNAAILNRVTGALPSHLDGTVNANGQVFLVNRNGVVLGPGGRVNASGFVASTLDIADADFLEGRLRFSGDGASAGVSNAGSIDIFPEGYAALLGGKVENTGTIRVPFGRVGLGAGERITLDLSASGFMQVALPSDSEDQFPLIEQSGKIISDGGLIEIQAATARNLVRNAVNLSGPARSFWVAVTGVR